MMKQNPNNPWCVIQISVVCNPIICGPIQCPVVAPIETPVVTKYSSLRKAKPYSCYGKSKLSIWSDTPIYTFSIDLNISTSFCICSRMFAPIQNYLYHSSVHGVKTMSRLHAIYRRWWKKLQNYLDHSSVYEVKTMSPLHAIYRRQWQDQRLCMPHWFHWLTIRQVLEYSRYNTNISNNIITSTFLEHSRYMTMIHSHQTI